MSRERKFFKINADEEHVANLFLIIVVLLSCFATGVNSQNRQAIVNVAVVDVAGKDTIQPGKTILIEDGRIAMIGPKGKVNIPAGTLIIKGKGKYVIPGLWDMHTHLSYFGEEALDLLVMNGVTAVRDMGGDLQQIDLWRKEIIEGTRTGPMIFRAGPFIDGTKSMDAQRTSFTRVVHNADDGRASVIELQQLGVDIVKIHSRVPREAFFAIASEARSRNMLLGVHAPRDVTVSEISDAGARTIEHTESLLGKAIYEKNEALRESLTEESFKILNSSAGDSIFAKIRHNKNYYNPTLISLYLLNGSEYEKNLGPRLLPIVRKLYQAGIPLITGSDFATKQAGIMPGIDLHGELELFVEAGMTPLQALRCATLNAAMSLNVSDSVGTIEVGKLAHVVLLNANPTENISNTKKIFAIFLHGKVLRTTAYKKSGSEKRR